MINKASSAGRRFCSPRCRSAFLLSTEKGREQLLRSHRKYNLSEHGKQKAREYKRLNREKINALNKTYNGTPKAIARYTRVNRNPKIKVYKTTWMRKCRESRKRLQVLATLRHLTKTLEGLSNAQN